MVITEYTSNKGYHKTIWAVFFFLTQGGVSTNE